MNASGIVSGTIRMSCEVKLRGFGSSLDLCWVGRSSAISPIWLDWALNLLIKQILPSVGAWSLSKSRPGVKCADVFRKLC